MSRLNPKILDYHKKNAVALRKHAQHAALGPCLAWLRQSLELPLIAKNASSTGNAH